ncbi:Frag1/DRAM/Sfk1 family-domain-containing protein [Flammula alnicola]|nr:Frag1/DRAM/Sfk1 family-domain-containing protein [Flammula alnicola]
MARLPAAALARLHTVFASAAFLSALAIGSLSTFTNCKERCAQYPDEWFPSVSAQSATGIQNEIYSNLIALTSGPRFAIVFLQYYLHHSTESSLPTFVFLFGIIRTLSCGGWVYITSSDDHDIHDFMMILYMVCNIPWMLVGIAATPSSSLSVRRKRKLIAAAFFTTLIPLVYFFIQHKVHRIPGAYTRYAFFEWGLIFFDVLYDSVAEQEFRESGLHISLTGIHPNTKISAAENIPNAQNISINEKPKNGKPETDSPDPVVPAIDGTVHALPDKPMADAVSAALAPASEHPIPTKPWRDTLSFMSDVYLSYIFWSLFTALIPTLFYFSVWKLGIAGHELALLSLLLRIVNTQRTLTFLRSRIYEDTLRAGCPSVRLPDGHRGVPRASPGGRLALVAVANIIAVMRQAVLWSGVVDGETDVGYQAIGRTIQCGHLSTIKQTVQQNGTSARLSRHLRIFDPTCPKNHADTGQPHKASSSSSASSSPKSAARTPSSALYRSAPPLLPTQPPIRLEHPHRMVMDGLRTPSPPRTHPPPARLPNHRRHGARPAPSPPLRLIIGAAGEKGQLEFCRASAVVWLWRWECVRALRVSGLAGYGGGLGVAVFLMSVLPLGFERAAEAAVGSGGGGGGGKELRVAKVYTTALGVYCVLNLASIFTVAYAFVPGGVYLRERTDLVTIAQMVFLLPLFEWPFLSSSTSSSSPSTAAPGTPPTRSSRCCCQVQVAHPHYPRTSASPLLADHAYRLPRIWAVHFGIDNEGHDSQRGMMNLIRDMELDVVGLLETDLHRTAFGHRDLSRLIVEETNYNVDIGPGPNQHTWGCVLLSKFPIISTKHHLLPSPNGELAPAIEAVLDVYGTEVLVLVSHNGQEEDALDRELQATALAEIMAASTRPVIFLGYVVSKPWAPRPSPYGIMVLEGNVRIYLLSRVVPHVLARLSRGIITDTGDADRTIRASRHGHGVTNDTLQARYLRSRKEELPVDHWFPMAYYGDAKSGGVNGHYYHVFNTVSLVYKLPEGAIVNLAKHPYQQLYLHQTFDEAVQEMRHGGKAVVQEVVDPSDLVSMASFRAFSVMSSSVNRAVEAAGLCDRIRASKSWDVDANEELEGPAEEEEDCCESPVVRLGSRNEVRV